MSFSLYYFYEIFTFVYPNNISLIYICDWLCNHLPQNIACKESISSNREKKKHNNLVTFFVSGRIRGWRKEHVIKLKREGKKLKSAESNEIVV